tara:strand:- start:5040 stop:5660 length:621 start_codon:yes stop_codon:yes gene_type:complete
MSQTTCQLIGTNAITDSNLASSIYATAAQVNGVNTTGSITTGTTALTVTSGTGINNGDAVIGEGITPGTTVVSGGGTTSLVLSANAAATLSSKPVSFFSSLDLLTPANTAGQLCKAWVNFNGTGTVAIRASYNVSSITDNNVGDYTVNFTTAMVDANYAALGTSKDDGAGSYTPYITSQATGNVRIGTKSQSTVFDSGIVCIAIFR